MIKHELEHWGVEGPKKSWWYKLQLFNPAHHQDNLLYFDLDVIILRDMEWIRQCNPELLWAIRDFRYLQRPNEHLLNSSVMWWNVSAFADIWYGLQKENLQNLFNRWPGDQDYITHTIPLSRRRFFEDQLFESYRWQVLDGGYNFQRRCHREPGAGARVAGDTAVVVFHGQPKPHQLPASELRTIWSG
jgi:lipopolysaccharide biosynthesis glycosyltransferase